MHGFQVTTYKIDDICSWQRRELFFASRVITEMGALECAHLLASFVEHGSLKLSLLGKLSFKQHGNYQTNIQGGRHMKDFLCLCQCAWWSRKVNSVRSVRTHKHTIRSNRNLVAHLFLLQTRRVSTFVHHRSSKLRSAAPWVLGWQGILCVRALSKQPQWRGYRIILRSTTNSNTVPGALRIPGDTVLWWIYHDIFMWRTRFWCLFQSRVNLK